MNKVYENLLHKEELKSFREWRSEATEEEINHGHDILVATIDDAIMVFTAYMLPTTRRGLDSLFEKDL